MPSTTSSATVLRRPPAQHAARGRSPDPVRPDVTAAVPAPVVRTGSLRRVLSLLGELAGFVGVALAFPLAILAIGIPIALLVRLGIWAVRGLSGW